MAEPPLQRIFAELSSDDFLVRLAALRELGSLESSSPAILALLERLSLDDPQAPVRRMAAGVLANPTHRLVRAAASTLPHDARTQLLTEIDTWQTDGIVSADQARILRQRYNYDIPAEEPHAQVDSSVAPAPPVPAPASLASAPEVQAAPPAAAIIPPPARVKVEPVKPEPSEPGPTLMQRLLSQATVNVFLYLGAFLVIGAALILAALVQAARLPILAGVAVVFAASSILLKKRLPQPSFALFIVFSFLLPILAGVLGESLNLSGRAVYAYWSLVLLIMAASWAFSTWFYGSRLFSVASFLSLAFGSILFVRIFTDSVDWMTVAAGVAALSGLAGTMLLRSWKSDTFATPLSVTTQTLSLAVAAVAVGSAASSLFNSHAPDPWQALALMLTWLIIAAFYAGSSRLHRFVLLPWLAAASLVPAAWWSPQVFAASPSGFTASYWVWATLLAAGSEVLARRSSAEVRRFSLPLILVSLVLFISAAVSASLVTLDLQSFVVLAGAALVYTLLHGLRPRAALWTTALLFGLAAYFVAFTLPIFQDRPVLAIYQWLGATLLLMLPELFFRDHSGWRGPWRLPLLILGAILTIISVALRLSEYLNDQLSLFDWVYQPAAQLINFASYALLMLGYALHFRKPRLLYFATASAAFAALITVSPIRGTHWLPVLTGVCAAYYAAGLALRLRERARGWGNVLRTSSLWLGALITTAALIVGIRVAAPYVAFIAALFIAELHLRPDDRLEPFGPLFLSAAAVLALPHDDINSMIRLLLVISLIWLLVDLAYARTLQRRRLELLTRATGAALALVNVILMLMQPVDPRLATLCLALYALVALAYALQFHRPSLLYFATAAAAASLFFWISPVKGTLWLPVFTGLSVVYYAAGLLLKTRPLSPRWGGVLRDSGLGLGTLVIAVAVAGMTKPGAPYAVVIAAMFFAETYLRPDDRLELTGPLFLSAAALLALPIASPDDVSRLLLVISVIWLLADVLYKRTLNQRRWSLATRLIATTIVLADSGFLILGAAGASLAALTFGVYALFAAFDAWFYRSPRLGYAAASFLPLSIFFALRAAGQTNWLYAIVVTAALYYAAGYVLRRRARAPQWSQMLITSGLGLATINAASAPLQTGMQAAIPVAIAATLFAAEAFALRNVWLGFPANALYMEAYVLILLWLRVDQPQFYSVGAAVLGLTMHYLLTRAGSKRGAFITGTASQLVLLGTSYIQLVSTENLAFFTALFFQGLVVLAYGIFIRSRSLVVMPMIFIVLSVIAVIYSALKGLSTVILIGGAGILLLALGIGAVLLRERLIKLGDQWSTWKA